MLAFDQSNSLQFSPVYVCVFIPVIFASLESGVMGEGGGLYLAVCVCVHVFVCVFVCVYVFLPVCGWC